ncbi:hypothetical protein Tco_1370931 [Tanacetum coccineum]
MKLSVVMEFQRNSLRNRKKKTVPDPTLFGTAIPKLSGSISKVGTTDSKYFAWKNFEFCHLEHVSFNVGFVRGNSYESNFSSYLNREAFLWYVGSLSSEVAFSAEASMRFAL